MDGRGAELIVMNGLFSGNPDSAGNPGGETGAAGGETQETGVTSEETGTTTQETGVTPEETGTTTEETGGTEEPVQPEETGTTAEETGAATETGEQAESTQPEESDGAADIFSETGTAVSGNGTEGTGMSFQQYLPVFIGLAAAVLLLLAWTFIRRKQKKGKEAVTEEIEEISEKAKEQTAGQNAGTVTRQEQIVTAASPKSGYSVGRLHSIGRRSGQQDSFAVSDVEDENLCREKGVIAIVADGMGGLSDGDKISSMVTLSIFRHFHERPIVGTAGDVLLQMLREANEEVNRFLGGKQGKCGSTLVAGIVRDRKCYWISVGDSHIYLYRGGSLMQLNREHVYGADLDAKAANGEISREEAMRDPQRGALTSYIGMGRLEKVDRNLTPLTLQAGDRLLFMTDGVFGTLSEKQIAEAMRYPVEESVRLMDEAIRAVGKSNQDNYTAVILECH